MIWMLLLWCCQQHLLHDFPLLFLPFAKHIHCRDIFLVMRFVTWSFELLMTSKVFVSWIIMQFYETCEITYTFFRVIREQSAVNRILSVVKNIYFEQVWLGVVVCKLHTLNIIIFCRKFGDKIKSNEDMSASPIENNNVLPN